MKSHDAVQALSALAYGARMDIFRILVEAGEDGMPAGHIAEQCGMSASTLSFHLNQLKAAGLVSHRRLGRSLIYSANRALMDTLIGYLGETFHSGPAGVANQTTPDAHAGTGSMSDAVYNVLFIGAANSGRSIMAEAILNREGRGRFRGFSAGVGPSGEVSGVAQSLLHRMNYPTSALRSKPLAEFCTDGAPLMHFAFTVADLPEIAALSALPGQPLRADWSVPDPLTFVGTEAEIGAFYHDVFRMLHNRITVFTALPFRSLDRLSLQRRLDAIGREPAAAGVA